MRRTEKSTITKRGLPPGKQTAPIQVTTKNEENLECIVEEKEDEYQWQSRDQLQK